MDYFELTINAMTVFGFFLFSVMASFGKLALTGETLWERVALASLYVYIAADNVKPFAESLHKILGGN